MREKWQDKPYERQTRVRQAMRRAFGLPIEPVEARTNAVAPRCEGQKPDVPCVPLSWQTGLWDLRPLGGSPGESYAARRGLPLEICVQAKVRFSPSWMGRPALVFPLYDEASQLVAAQGRYTDGRDDPKARTIGAKRQGLFGTGSCWNHIAQGAPLVLTEAPLDALSLAACGFPALSLCGKSGVPAWFSVRCVFKTVFLAFDADEAGDEAARYIEPLLSAFGARVHRLRPESAKDWNELLVRSGRSALSDFLAEQLL